MLPVGTVATTAAAAVGAEAAATVAAAVAVVKAPVTAAAVAAAGADSGSLVSHLLLLLLLLPVPAASCRCHCWAWCDCCGCAVLLRLLGHCALVCTVLAVCCTLPAAAGCCCALGCWPVWGPASCHSRVPLALAMARGSARAAGHLHYTRGRVVLLGPPQLEPRRYGRLGSSAVRCSRLLVPSSSCGGWCS